MPGVTPSGRTIANIDAARLARIINGATAKATIVDADEFTLVDSEDSNSLKKTLWSTIKSVLSAVFLRVDGTVTGAVSQAQDFGSNGLKADSLVESTTDAGVTIEQSLLKDGKINVIQENTPATPTLAFGDGDTGFYESADGTIAIALEGVSRFAITGSFISANVVNGGAIYRVGSSNIIPSLLPDKRDLNTGIGHPTSGADQLSLIAGGVEGIRITEETAAITALVNGTLQVGTVINAGADTGKNLVLDGSNNVDFRTNSELRDDLGLSATTYLLADGTRALTGNLAVDALITIDGRDVSVDGTKLDGIEALADVSFAWSTVAVDTTAVAGNGYNMDATGGNRTLTLPASPSEGNVVGFNDAYEKATTNVITIARNGSNIEALAEDMVVDVDGANFLCVYADATRGWEIQFVGAVGGTAVSISGTPVANDFARFTDGDTIAGLSYAETMAALSNTATAAFDFNAQNLTDVGTVQLNGGQIAFPAQAVPSADVKTLDDYQEGEWTVTITPLTSGTVTLGDSQTKGAYTKVGRMVFCHGQIKITSISSPVGDLQISLPFEVGNLTESAENAQGSISLYGINFNASWCVASIQTGWTYFKIREVIDNAAWDFLEGADLGGGGAEFIGFGLNYVSV